MPRHYRRPSPYPTGTLPSHAALLASNANDEDAPKKLMAPNSLNARCVGIKSYRYLSEWDDDVVVINRARVGAKEDVREIDLTALILDCSGGESIYDRPMPLTHFRPLTDATKIAINTVLERNHRGNIWVNVTRAVRTMMRIYIWMMRAGVYELRDLTQQMIDGLLLELSKVQWGRILRYHRALLILLLQANGNPEIASKIAGRARKDRRPCVNIVEIERLTGIPMPDDAIPRWFRRRIAAVTDDHRAGSHYRRDFFAPSPGEIRETMMVFNLLALHPIGGDSISVMPFPKVESRLDELISQEPGRTENIDLGTCMKLMNESLIWLYDRGPLLLEMLAVVRTALEQPGDEESKNRIARIAVRKKYAELKPRLHLPYDKITLNNGPNSILGMVKTLQSAMSVLIGMNHGRRTNEVVGRDAPYGLYYGVLRSSGESLVDWTVEFYIEKGLQDYAIFAANQLVADAINLLQEIYVQLRPLGSQPPKLPKTRKAGRQMKLFASRSISAKGLKQKPFQLYQRPPLAEYFRLAGCNFELYYDSQLPFRRMFVTLFLNRYDCPELSAISRHLGHLSLWSTLPYYTDNPGRPHNKRIQNLISKRRQVTVGVMKALREGESEYLRKLVEDCFVGRDTSGFFPFLILKLAKRFSANVEFRMAPLRDKVERVADTLERRGYTPTVLQHGACMARNPRHTLKKAKCFKEGDVHRENASPAMCQNCVNFMCNDGYIAQWQEDLAEARKDAENFHFPVTVRTSRAAHADFMDTLIEAEQKIAIKVREVLHKITENWPEIIKD